jgi:hypothetical protein
MGHQKLLLLVTHAKIRVIVASYRVYVILYPLSLLWSRCVVLAWGFAVASARKSGGVVLVQYQLELVDDGGTSGKVDRWAETYGWSYMSFVPLALNEMEWLGMEEVEFISPWKSFSEWHQAIQAFSEIVMGKVGWFGGNRKV